MPDYNIAYTEFLEERRESIRKEVAKAAARTSDDKGNLVYDLVKIYSSDLYAVDDFINESIRQIYARFKDVCQLLKNEEEGRVDILLYLPDIDPEMVDEAGDEINRFITMQVCSLWLATRVETLAKFYSDRSVSSMERLVELLRTRKTPTRQ